MQTLAMLLLNLELLITFIKNYVGYGYPSHMNHVTYLIIIGSCLLTIFISSTLQKQGLQVQTKNSFAERAH